MCFDAANYHLLILAWWIPLAFIVKQIRQWYSFLTCIIWESSSSCHHFWRRVWLGIVIAVSCFLFSTLSISSHSLLTWKVCSEKSADSHTGATLNERSWFSLAAFKFSLSLILNNLVIMCFSVYLFSVYLFSLFWVLWISWLWRFFPSQDLWSFLPLFL